MNKKEQLKRTSKAFIYFTKSFGFLFLWLYRSFFIGISFCEWDYTKGLSGIHFNFG